MLVLEKVVKNEMEDDMSEDLRMVRNTARTYGRITCYFRLAGAHEVYVHFMSICGVVLFFIVFFFVLMMSEEKRFDLLY